MVMVVPKEVMEYVKDFKKEKFNENAGSKIDADTFKDGYSDGKKFDPTKRLTEN